MALLECMKQDGVDLGEDKVTWEWLGQKWRWGGLEVNQLTQTFYRLAEAIVR
jgi:hypothetical protein